MSWLQLTATDYKQTYKIDICMTGCVDGYARLVVWTDNGKIQDINAWLDVWTDMHN